MYQRIRSCARFLPCDSTAQPIIWALLFAFIFPARAHATEILDALQANELAAKERIILVDIRTSAERTSFGVPRKAIWVEWKGPEGAAAFIGALMVALPDRSAAIAFICSVGHRSGQAARLAERAGYGRVYDVAEGMNGAILGPGWRAWGLPVDRAD